MTIVISEISNEVCVFFAGCHLLGLSNPKPSRSPAFFTGGKRPLPNRFP